MEEKLGGQVLDKLTRIQTELKVPKNLYNSFGNYKYRNAEGICEAVKPFLAKEGCSLLLSDEIVEVGGRVYVRATATLYDNGTGKNVSVSAMAREGAERKGMDESQITGAASSYARKYALNGLFLLDDTKDADMDEYRRQTANGQPETHRAEAARQTNTKRQETQAETKQGKPVGSRQKISPDKAEEIRTRCATDGIAVEKVLWLYKVGRLEDMTESKYQNAIDNWEKIRER